MELPTGRRQRSLVLGALAVGLSLVLSAAALAAGTGATTSSTRAAAGQLIVLEDDLAPALDYDGATAAHPLLQEIVNNIMEPLLDYPLVKQGDILNLNYKVGPFGFDPRLATSWTKKGLVWTFNLRKGVKSCAGNTFTADDVIYTAERAISVSGGSPVGWFLMNVGGVFPLDPVTSKDPAAKTLHGEVTKVDDYTVQFKQLHPNELFPRILQIFAWDIWDSKVMKAHATAKDPWSHDYAATVDAPGFGAYCLKQWNKGSEMQLAANPNYYRGQPEFKTIIIRKVPANSNRVAALKSGNADLVEPLTPQEYANVATDPKVKVLSAYNNKIFALGMNYSFPPFTTKNILVRQAMAYALPYADIIKQDFYGQAKPWYGLVESNYYGYKKIARYRTDLAKAKALLAKAGFPGGKGLEKYKANLHLYYVAERRSLLEPIANRIRTALAQIGMQISLNPISQTEYTDRGLTKYDMPMFLRDADWPLGPDAGYSALLFYVSKKNGGLNTPTNYASAKVDALFAKSQNSVGAQRLGYLHQLQDIIMDDLPLIPIAEPSSQAAMRKGLTGWAITGENIFQFWYFKSA